MNSKTENFADDYTRIREDNYDLIVRNSSEGIIITQDGYLKYIDPQIISFMGFPKEELHSKPFIEFIYPEDRDLVLKNYRRRLNENLPVEKYSFRVLSKTGKLAWLEVMGNKIELQGKPATLILVNEVTAKVEAGLKLKESEEKYKSVMYSSPNGILLIDQKGMISDLNDSFLKLTGYKIDDYIGKVLYKIPGLDNIEREKLRKQILQEEPFRDQEPFLILLTHKNKNKKYAEVRLRPFKTETKTFGIIATFIDITEKYLTSEKIAKSEKKLRELYERMQEALLMVSKTGVIQECNPYFIRLTGFASGDIMGKSIQEIIPDEWKGEEKLIRKEKVERTGYSGVYEIEILTKNGPSIPVEVNCYLWKDENDKPDGFWYFFKDIVTRKQYENELLEREKQLQTVIQYFPVPMILEDLSFVKDYMTEHNRLGVHDFSEFFANNKDELIRCINNIKITFSNQNAYEFLGAEEPDDFKKLWLTTRSDELFNIRLSMLQSFWNGEYVFEKEAVLLNKFSEARNTIIKANILPGHEKTWDTVLVSIIDLSESIKSDSLIRTLSQAITHSPVSVIITDIDGKIEFVNPKFSEVSGYSFDEVYGKTPAIMQSGKTPVSVYKSLWETIIRGEEWTGEILNKRKNGELFWELASISGVKNDDGRITHFVAIKEDITARKTTEDELLFAKHKAEESDRLKTAFLANMSHEIRTPMNAIVGFSEIIRTTDVSGPEREEYFNIINSSCNTLSNLIDDIIDLAKIEAGQTKIVEDVCRPFSVMKELQTYFGEEVFKSGKSLRIILEEDLPPEIVIRVDEFRLRQILANLLGNAVKFTEKGFITWGANLIKEKELQFYVKDTGIGIPIENIELIFDRFRQMDGSSVRKFGGTGLGLSVSKSLVELMGGKIWVESQVGRGSEFFFTLPYKPIVEGSLPQDIIQEDEEKVYYWKNKSILIVEDNLSNFEFIKAVLSKTKAKLLWADTGVKAVNTIRKKRKINLVLMDLQIPEMDGLEATRLIKKIAPDIPVIAQTAFAFRQDKKRAMDAGCDDYISKPVKPLDLLNVMARYI